MRPSPQYRPGPQLGWLCFVSTGYCVVDILSQRQDPQEPYCVLDFPDTFAQVKLTCTAPSHRKSSNGKPKAPPAPRPPPPPPADLFPLITHHPAEPSSAKSPSSPHTIPHRLRIRGFDSDSDSDTLTPLVFV
ncbi:hypothetical protein CCUS01_16857 [Colletotrichum cuscutae]|uniref:Uncharacterized protein n=1 Tax=Colletotrichum cuscutae TaxID=1209917 RepID=A0AAI9VDH0_9PEZI|nr:hypothetical protein CCUS01_16857 [Colletotrichum cuscutae]